MDLLQEFNNNKKKIALLIDPDKCSEKDLHNKIKIAEEYSVSFLFVGGSLLSNDNFNKCVSTIKSLTKIPLILFPGNTNQINFEADGILFLSLISGRNPELLIGKHVHSALKIKNSNLEVISTGYMLIESGPITSVQYMSNTLPIPKNKSDIAVSTALAGELIGMKSIYLEAGSGAENHVPLEMINEVKNKISVPLIVGGGIRNKTDAQNIFNAGANIIVLGSIAENDIDSFKDICKLIK